MRRLTPLEAEDIAPEHRDIIGTGMNLHKVMVHSPRTARMSRQVGLYLRRDCTLDRRLCELAIIQVASMARSAYEYTHHLKIAEDLGVPADQLAAIAKESEGIASGLDGPAVTVLRAAREMWTELHIHDTTFAALQCDLSAEHIVDLIFAISFYCGFVRLTGSLALDLEPAFLPYLERYPFPSI
jgi:alkylhydroperoxidase family enzyme